MADSNAFIVLSKTITKHAHLLDLLAQLVVDMCCIQLSQLEKCSADGCTEPATMMDSRFGIHMCDHHAARAIIASKNASKNDNFLLNFNDAKWCDLPEAKAIRHLVECVKLIKVSGDTITTIH